MPKFYPLFMLFLFASVAVADFSGTDRFEVKYERTMPQIAAEFTCAPSLVSPYIFESGYGGDVEVNYGFLTIKREDIGLKSGSFTLSWKNQPLCNLLTRDAEDIYISSADRKILLESHGPKGSFVEAYAMDRGCEFLGWSNTTAHQNEFKRFIGENGERACSKVKLHDCVEAERMVRRFIQLDLAGERLRPNEEVDLLMDGSQSARNNWHSAILTLDSTVVGCTKTVEGFSVNVNHEIYGELVGEGTHASLAEMEKKKLKKEVSTVLLLRNGNEIKINSKAIYIPHVSLKKLMSTPMKP